MSRARRQTVIAVGLLVLLTLGLGAYFYYQFFAPTGAAVRHAEAFQYRRMTVARQGEDNVYRYFFVSNRNIEDPDGDIGGRFGRTREDRLKFGSFDVRIEPSLGLGMLVNPTQWFQNEEIRFEGMEGMEHAAFIERVAEQVAASPLQSLLIVVHGFKEAFPTALRKTAFVGHILDLDTPILVFDWPGNQGRTLRGYRRARAVAEESGIELAATIRLVVDEIGPQRVWLVANSLGAQVVADAFGVLGASEAFADPETELEDVVLTAPDVDRGEFDATFEAEISALTRQLTVYVSSNDRALVLSRLVNASPRRGEGSLSPDQLSEARAVAEFIEPDSDQVTLVDVTPVNRTRNFHNFSLETPEFFDDLFLRLVNPATPQTRLLYPFEAADGNVYWVLTRGR